MMLVKYNEADGEIIGTVQGDYNWENILQPTMEVEVQDLDGKKVDLDTLGLIDDGQ